MYINFKKYKSITDPYHYTLSFQQSSFGLHIRITSQMGQYIIGNTLSWESIKFCKIDLIKYTIKLMCEVQL